MQRWFENKVALVTGASSGIGRASAIAFAREGASVVVNYNTSVKGGEETVKMIREAGGDAISVQADVAKAAEVEAMVNKTIEVFGRLDCALNNAGVPAIGKRIADCSEEDWDRVIEINLKGVWLCMKYEIPQMLKQGKGAIVNTSSAVGLVGAEGRDAYATSKHGVVGLTKVAALDYVKDNIRINAICPGGTLTPMMERVFARGPEWKEKLLQACPMGRFGMPEEIAEAVVWLCSDAASFVTGHALPVDGGWVAG
jgi:NAD(P)-dependent dehydrogenase (short-subunit alcohol dehydrogenase family)